MKTLYPSRKTTRIAALAMLLLSCCFMQQAFAQQPGNAHSFNGTSQYDSIRYKTTSSAIAYEYTVEAWVKLNTLTGTQTIFSTRGLSAAEYSFDMKIVNGTSLHGDVGDGAQWLTTSADASFTFSTGRWYHIAYVISYSASKYTIYVNGSQVGTGPFNVFGVGTFLFDANHLNGYIGANPRIGSEYFNGSIDEVKVYAGYVTQAQVQADMVGNTTGLSPYVYYNFNQSSGTVLTDAANNSTCNAINNPAWVESFAMVIPYNVTLTPTAGGFTTTWTKPTGTFTSYKLQVSANANFSPLVAGYGPDYLLNNLTSIEVFGLQKGTSYYYRIIADKSSVTGQGAYMAPIAFTTVQPATVTSFTPVSGPVGTTVTITGVGFSTTAANNLVRFGGVKALVTSATATTLTVTVPAGAGYGPISVRSSNNTIGTSSAFFNPTFSNGDNIFTVHSLEQPVRTASPGSALVKTADFDGDGKLDVAGMTTYSGSTTTLSVSRNTTSGNNISFAAPVNYTVPSSQGHIPVIADFNGDGKLDIIDVGNTFFQVFTNNSTSGAITLTPGTNFTYPTSNTADRADAADIDGDGKPDLIINNHTAGVGDAVTVYRNTSTGSTISFNTTYPYNYAYNPGNDVTLVRDAGGATIAIGDFNGDGKTDIAIPDPIKSKILLFRNTSTPGEFSLYQDPSIAPDTTVDKTNKEPFDIIAADFSGDGKLDIATIFYVNSSKISIFTNNSTSSTISFGNAINVATTSRPRDIAAGDMNGDGRVDLLGAFTQGPLVLLNQTSGSTVSFSPQYKDYAYNQDFYHFNPNNIAAGDMNGDGKMDALLIGADNTGTAFAVLKNRPGYPHISSFSPQTAATDSVITIKGTNFSTVTTVRISGTTPKSFTALNDTTITAVIRDGGNYTSYVYVGNAAGADSMPGFTYKPKPSIFSVTPDTGYKNTIVTLKGQYFTNVRSVTFGGIPASFYSRYDDNTIIAQPVASGGTGNITVTTDAGSGSIAYTFVFPPVITSFSPAAGGYGDTLIIKGHNFIGVKRVYPNYPNYSKSQLFAVVDSTTIIEIVRYDNSSYPVTVETIAGTANSANSFTSLPMKCSISGPSAVCTSNGTAYITFTGLHAANYVRFRYAINNGPDLYVSSAPNGTSPTATVAIPSTPGTYTYTLYAIYDDVNSEIGGPQGTSTITVLVGSPVTSTTNLSVCANALPYAWNGINCDTAGTYTVHLTSVAGCDSAAKLVLTIIQSPTATYSAVSYALCYGVLTNTTVAASGGTAPYQYSLDSGSYQASNIFSTGAGTHSVTVKDAKGCTAVTNPINITGPATALALSLTASTNCAGDNDTVRTTATGGYGKYTYSINGGAYQNSRIFAGLNLGTKTVTAKDSLSCTTSQAITIAPLSASITATKMFVCYGGFSTIAVKASSGKLPYQYSLDGGVTYQTSGSFKVAAGTFSATVKDAAGCTVVTGPITITGPAAPLTLSLTSSTNCAGDNDTVRVTAGGGYGKYTYSIDNGPYQNSRIFSGLSTGTKSVTAKDSNSCTLSQTITVVTLSATLTASKMFVCYGGFTTIGAKASAGKSPYKYSIDGGVTYQTATSFKVAAGNYSLTVKDAWGCTFTTAPLAITQAAAPLSISLATTNITCIGANNATITTTLSGGFSSSYTYSIDSINFSGSNVFSGLKAGLYKVSGKDFNGCIVTKSATIAEATTTCLVSSQEVTSASKHDMQKEMKVHVLPNPTVAEFMLTIEGGDNKHVAEILVTDMYGKTIYHTRGAVTNNFSFGKNFAAGMYIARVLNGSNTQIIKLVKGN